MGIRAREEYKEKIMKELTKLVITITATFVFLLQFDILRITKIYFFDGIYLLIVASIINYLIFRNRTKNIAILIVTVFSMNFGFFVLFEKKILQYLFHENIELYLLLQIKR